MNSLRNRVMLFLKDRLIEPVLESTASHNLVSLVSFILEKSSRTIVRNSSGYLTILVLGRIGLDEDVLAVNRFDAGRNISEIIMMDRGYIKMISTSFLGNLRDNTYAAFIKDNQQLREYLRNTWGQVMRHIAGKSKTKVMVTANWRYWGEQELAYAARSKGVPFVAIHKECFKNQAQIENARVLYRRSENFQGSYILTHNEIEKNLLLQSGVATSKQVIVTGAPRFDELHASRVKVSSVLKDRKKFTIFSVSPRAGMPIDRSLDEGESNCNIPKCWTRLCRETLYIWTEVAKVRPNIDFTFKVKSQVENLRVVEDWCNAHPMPSNVSIEKGGLARGVLMQSVAACGFNTTAILDALALGLPVAVIRYGDALSTHKNYLHDYDDCGTYLYDLEGTLNWVDDISNLNSPISSELSESVKHLLEKYVGNSDGQASLRVLQALLKCSNRVLI